MNSTNPFKELEEKPPSHRLCSFQTSASSPLLSASSPPFFVHDQFSYSSFFNLPPLHFRLKLKAYFPYMTHISCIHPLIPKVCQFCISLELLRINFSLWDSSHHDSKTLQLQRVLTLPFVLFVSHCNLYPIQCFFFFSPYTIRKVSPKHPQERLLAAGQAPNHFYQFFLLHEKYASHAYIDN